jgi:Na+/H+-translocating membrane pyrophosphatase
MLVVHGIIVKNILKLVNWGVKEVIHIKLLLQGYEISIKIKDTVGDPCKDTAGPSIHILIKLYSTITIVMVPLFVD